MTKALLFLFLSAGISASAQTRFLDSSFHHNGLQDSLVSSFNPQLSGLSKAVAIQPDGKILLALEMQNQMNLMRLNANGTKDMGFATGGLFQDAPSSLGTTIPTDVVVQPDGKVLFLGYAYFNNQREDIVLYRLLPNGSLDSSFGNSGLVITSSPGSNSHDYGQKILLRPSGKILVVGSTNTQNSDDRHLMIQYDAAGNLDASFGSGGLAVRGSASGRAMYGAGGLLQPDGKIVVYGAQYQGNGSVGLVTRYDSTGTIDATFGTAGHHEEKVHTNQATSVKTVALQSNGKMVVGLYAIPDTMHAVRLSTSGVKDVSFGSGGLVTIKVGGFSDWGFLEKIIALPGDSLLFGCNAVVNTNQYDFTVLRLKPAGIVDSAWGDNGKVVADFHTDYDNLYNMAVQPDGKIVACGSSRQNDNTTYSYASVARFKLNPRSTSTGVSDANAAAGALSLYPNPATNVLRIEGALSGDQITIWNSMGQVALQQTLSSPTIALDALPAGLYNVLVARRGTIIGQEKLVKE